MKKFKMKTFTDILCFILAWVLVFAIIALYMATGCTTIDVIVGIMFHEMTLKLFIKWLILVSISALSLYRIMRLYKTEMEKERKDDK